MGRLSRIVVSITTDIFDGVKKRFGFGKRGEELTQRARKRESQRTPHAKTACTAPPAPTMRDLYGCQATVMSLLRYTSWIAFRSFTPSAIGRWKALRPLIRPLPPARLLMTAVATASSESLAPDAPPELIKPERPMKQLATW